MRPISAIEANKLLNKQYEQISILVKFLKSRKGREMVENVNIMPIEELFKRFEAPKPTAGIHNTTQLRNVLKSSIITAGMQDVKPPKYKGMENYTMVLHKKKQNGELKPTKNLSKFEMKKLNMRDMWEIKRDQLGKPILRTIKDNDPDNHAGYRLIYDKETGSPYYKYTPKSNGKGIAAKCNDYANHKIKKWLVRHPEPTEIDLKMDLFPHELMVAWRSSRNIAVESIRNAVAAKYYKVKDPSKELRLYELGVTHIDNKPDIYWEQECDPYIYGYPLCPIPAIPLQNRLSDAIKHSGPNIIKLKVYNRNGELIESVSKNNFSLRIAA